MEVTKYLCEFFFTNFWHWLGLVIVLMAVRFGTIIIDKSHQAIIDKREKKEECYDDWRHPDTSVCHDLCRLHQAKTNEYYSEVGLAKYSPKFGTVEVVDEYKEMELEMKRLEEEEN